jgi:hypothetical protein
MLNAKKMVKLLVLVMAATMLVTLVARAADANKPEPPKPVIVKVQGTVSVVKDANEIKSAKVTTKEKVVYQVVLNTKGLELAKNLNGKEVILTATVTQQDGQKWLDVRSFREVQKTPEAPPKEK